MNKASSPIHRMNIPLSSRWWAQITTLMLILVELCWLVPWYRTVSRVDTIAPLWQVALAFGLVMSAAYSAALGMERLRLLRSVQTAGELIILGCCVVVTQIYLLDHPALDVVSGLVRLDPGAILLLFAVVWLWWRGAGLAREAIRPIVAWRRFELGLILFMAHIFIVNRLGEPGPGIGWYIFFFITGFSAVIFARVSYIGLAKGVAKNPFDRRWLVSTVSILGLAVLFAALMGSLLTGQYRMLLTWSVETIKFLTALALFLVSIPGLALAYLAGPMLNWLRQFFNYQPAPLEPIDITGGAYPMLPGASDPRLIPVQVQALLFWGILLLVISLLFLRIRRSRREAALDERDSLESLLKQGEARILLQQALQDALDGISARFRPLRRGLAAARIRRIYGELMDLCDQLGYPRPQNKTPDEFLPEMTELLAERQTDLQWLTQVYVKVRYGVYPETQEELTYAEQAWLRIQAEGQRMKKAGLHKLQTVESKEVLKPGM